MRQGITAVDILSLLSDIKEDVSFDTNRQIITFDTSMSMMDARHQNKSYIQEFTIGVRELLTNSNAEYPMKEAMIPIVNLSQPHKNTPTSTGSGMNCGYVHSITNMVE